MNQARVGLVVAAALLAFPATALAQAPAAAPPSAASSPEAPREINLDEPETPAAGKPAEDKPADDKPAAPRGLADICKIDPSACPQLDLEKAAARELSPQMYAVQQIYALRRHRFEINPYYALTMNDQFVSHNGPGLALNWYITNVLAVGANANIYAGMNSNSSFNFQTSRAARVGEPLTEYAWSAFANFSYVPAYGKLAGIGDFIFHWDLYLLGGVGAISTRPIAIVDPDNRTFAYKPKVSFHLGTGLRIFFNRWLAATFEISDYIFFDELENPKIAVGLDTNGQPKAQDATTWLADGTSFTNNIQAQVGLSVFLPFTWEYRLPK